MRHVFLLANLRQHALAEKLAEAVRRYVDGREDIDGHPRIFVRAGAREHRRHSPAHRDGAPGMVFG